MSDQSDGAIRVLCPTTDEVVATGVAISPSGLLGAVMSGNSFTCRACGQTHVWDKVPGDTLAVVRD